MSESESERARKIRRKKKRKKRNKHTIDAQYIYNRQTSPESQIKYG